MKEADVLCVGIAVADVMAKPIDEVPEWDHLSTFDHIEHHIGGCAVNTAVGLVKLGVQADRRLWKARHPCAAGIRASSIDLRLARPICLEMVSLLLG